MLQCVALCLSQCVAVCCKYSILDGFRLAADRCVLQRFAVCYSVLLCVLECVGVASVSLLIGVRCSVLQCVSVLPCFAVCCYVFWSVLEWLPSRCGQVCVAACCSMLQCVAVCCCVFCSVLECVAECASSVLQCVAVCCSMVQCIVGCW